jgi:predicted site-specific integrase-resolvase
MDKSARYFQKGNINNQSTSVLPSIVNEKENNAIRRRPKALKAIHISRKSSNEKNALNNQETSRLSVQQLELSIPTKS